MPFNGFARNSRNAFEGLFKTWTNSNGVESLSIEGKGHIDEI